MKMPFLLLLTAALFAQEAHVRTPALPPFAEPPVIVQQFTGDKVSAVLIATRDIQPGTIAMPVVIAGQQWTAYPAFQIPEAGVYQLGAVPSGYDMSVILTPPGGTAFLLNSRPFIRGYDYTAGVLTIYGTFQSGQVSLYVGSSLVPLKAVPQTDRIVLNMKPADGVTTVTVYQTGGACDSVVVRLR